MTDITNKDNAPRRIIGLAPGGAVSGAETVLLRDLVAARAAGWVVRIACSDGPLVARANDKGIARVKIPDLRLPSGPRVVALSRSLIAAFVAGRRLRHVVEPDELVIANGLNTLPALRLLRKRTRIAYFAHDVLVRRDRVALLRASLGAVDCAIAVSEAVARPLRELGVETHVVYNGTHWPVDMAPAPDQPPVVGISALLTPWKGHDVLLEAFARLGHSDAVLEIMGGSLPKDEDYTRRLHARADQPDLRGRVRFLGHLDDPLERMKHWTVAVSASVDPEAGPLTTLEAMSVGVPLVVTNHGGVVEVIGDAGVVVAPRDAEALAAGIERLLSDQVLWARARDAGPRQIVALHLTLADHEHRMLALLDKIGCGPVVGKE